MSPGFGQVDRAVEQDLKAGRRVTEMHAHDAVVDLAAIAVVLPRSPHGFLTALANPGLVHATDRLGMGMLGGHDLLAAVA